MCAQNDFISLIPEELPMATKSALRLYFQHRIRPGGFLLAVLENRFAEAMLRADISNREHLYPLALWLHGYAPAEAWGSPGNVDEWLRKEPQ